MDKRGRIGAVLLFLGVVVAGIAGYVVMRLYNLSFEEQFQIRATEGGREAVINALYGGYAGLGLGGLLLVVGLTMLMKSRGPSYAR